MAEPTPHARVDLDAVERNIERLQAYCDRHGLACRPHVKTHKLPAIAHAQMRAGAVGITCQKLGEAEVMVAAGLRDVLIAYPIVGAANLARLAALARSARISVAVDSAAVAEPLAEALAAAGLELDVLVEIDAGLGRTGVRDAAAARELALALERLGGVRFAGLLVYPTPADPALLGAARDAIAAVGVAVPRVSGGGTEGAWRTHELGLVDELRAGTYALGDRACLANGANTLEDCALRVRSTVVSCPEPGVAVLDAGSKALTTDPVEASGPGVGSEQVAGHGLVVERPRARVAVLYEEHARLELDPGEPGLAVGDTVDIVPNHACGAINLHDRVVVHRSGAPVGIWPVAARGAIA